MPGRVCSRALERHLSIRKERKPNQDQVQDERRPQEREIKKFETLVKKED